MSVAIDRSGRVDPAFVQSMLQEVFGRPEYRTFGSALRYGLLYCVSSETLARADEADRRGEMEFRWRRRGEARWMHRAASGLIEQGRLPEALRPRAVPAPPPANLALRGAGWPGPIDLLYWLGRWLETASDLSAACLCIHLDLPLPTRPASSPTRSTP